MQFVMNAYGASVKSTFANDTRQIRKIVRLPERFAGFTGPPNHSEKTDDFSALYICVRDGRVDEFWDAEWRAFVTTAGTCKSAGGRPFLNGH